MKVSFFFFVKFLGLKFDAQVWIFGERWIYHGVF